MSQNKIDFVILILYKSTLVEHHSKKQCKSLLRLLLERLLRSK